jgi:chromosome segregation ATPase
VPGLVKQVSRHLTGNKVPNVKKAADLARAACLELEKKLEEAQRKQKRLECAAKEEDERRRHLLESYRKLDPDFTLLRELLRGPTRSVETQVSDSDLAKASDKAREERLRASLKAYEDRANCLLSTIQADNYKEARRELAKKHPRVRECYERLTEKIQALRKKIRDEYGSSPTPRRGAVDPEKQAKNNERRRVLKRLREEGLAPPPIKRKCAKEETTGSTEPGTPLTPDKYPTPTPGTPVPEPEKEIPKTPPTPGRE